GVDHAGRCQAVSQQIPTAPDDLFVRGFNAEYWLHPSVLYQLHLRAVVRLVDERGLFGPKPPAADPAPEPGPGLDDLLFDLHTYSFTMWTFINFDFSRCFST